MKMEEHAPNAVPTAALMTGMRGLVISLAILLIGATLATPTDLVKKGSYKHFTGTIGQLRIQVDLIMSGNKLEGYYFYERYGQPISIGGEIKGKKWRLEEIRSKGGVQAMIEAEAGGGNTLKGVWRSVENNKRLEFFVKESYQDAVPLDVFEASKEITSSRGAKCSVGFRYIEPAQGRETQALEKTREVIAKGYFGEDFNSKGVHVRATLERRARDGLKECADYESNDEHLSEMRVLYNETGILTLSFDTYEYGGGAHGQGGSAFMVVDVMKGSVVKLEDIFKGDYEDYLERTATRKLKEITFKESKTKDLKKAGYWTAGVSLADDNFYITRNGIGAIYKPYEIAPYSFGTTNIFIPFKEMKKSLFRKGTPVYKMAFGK